MGRIQRGWLLTKISWGIIKQQPAALALPLVATVAQGAVAAIYVLGVTGTKSFDENNAAHYIVLYPLFVVLTIIATFSNAIIVAIADARLTGAPISFREALSATIGRLPLILGWSLLTATVGFLLRLLEERLPIAGRIGAALFGVAWSLATMLVIPVLVVEGVGPITAVKRSGKLFRERWGESLTGQALIGLPILLMGLPFILIGGLVATESVVIGIAIVAIALGAVIAFSGALTGIFQTALYRYAVDGASHGTFTADQMAMAFRPKKQPGWNS